MSKPIKKVEDIEINTGFIAFAVFIVIVLMVALGSFTIIPAGNKGIVFSKTQGVKDFTFGEGFHLKTPLIDEIVKVDVRTQKLEKTIASTSKDQQTVSVLVAINYKPNSDQVNKLYQEVGLDYVNRILVPAMEESIKFAMAQYKAEELLVNRDLVSLKALEVLRGKLEGKYLNVESVSLVNIGFSAAFNNAIEQKVIAEQQEQKAKNDLKRIEIEAEQVRISASAEADAKLLQAEAEAKSLELQQTALEESEEILQLRWIEKWDGAVPRIMTGDSSGFLMNIDSNTIVGNES